MKQNVVKEDLVTQESKPKTIKEEVQEIINRYLFEQNTSYVREIIKIQVDEYLRRKLFENKSYYYDDVGVDVVYDENDSTLYIEPANKLTKDLFLEWELL